MVFAGASVAGANAIVPIVAAAADGDGEAPPRAE